MALDWNKEITLSSVKGLFSKGSGSSGGSSSYPTKVTMNLYQGDAQATNVRSVGVVAVLLAVLIGLFVKFGVLDQLALVSQKQGELAQQQMIASSMAGSLDGYEETKEAYDSYIARYGTGSTDAISVLEMVENHVMNSTQVTSIVLADDTLTLTLYDVSLDKVGDLAKDLEDQDMVTSVNVTTATTQNADGQNTVSTIVLGLVGSEGEGE